MPGLKQLQRFSSDMMSLGDEVKIRATRGEKPVTVNIPQDVEDIDDSAFFENGLPVVSEEEFAAAKIEAEELEREANDFSEFTDANEQSPIVDNKEVEVDEAEEVPDVSDILSPTDDISEDDIDLSDFEGTNKEENESTPEPVAIEDMDLDSLLAINEEPEEKDEDKEENIDITKTEEISEDFFSNTPNDEAVFVEPAAEPNVTSFDTALFDMPDESESSETNTEELPDLDMESLKETLTDFDETEVKTTSEEVNATEEKEAIPNSITEEKTSDISINDELPSFGDENDVLNEIPDDINLDDILSGESTDLDINTESNAEDIKEDSSIDSGSEENTSSSFSNLDLSLPDDEVGTLSPEIDVPEEQVEKFDTTEINGLDFSNEKESDFKLGEVNASEDDDFSIPGFSDIETADLSPKPETKTESTEATGNKGKPKNTFTDSEYKRFLKNLEGYPLNVRIALEDFVVKNEFTDDAIFGVLEKVLRKVPARQVATELEKLLDISLEVPRDFERRSVAEYEAYKKSAEYQIRNRIIPGAIFSVAVAFMIFCLFTLTNRFIYKPIMANTLYKQGYALLEDNQFPQSEERFNQALAYRPVKKWFFRYAEGYRDHKQYDRSRMMYKAVLQRYNHDKKAGLDWANMEFQDIFNYEEGERILKREVLDYHINDRDAILALGDLYLEWATEKDETKFPLAKEQYDLLLQLYGENNFNLSRQMRYYIRKDDLREVLMYKEIFTSKKNVLSSQDLIELSGYMLDKRYGKLSVAEESLRSRIEDVRKLLENAVKSAPADAVALYNMGRYFVYTKSGKNAARFFEAAIKSFEAQTRRNKKNTYRYINTYRLLGEEMKNQKEYLLAEDLYGKGISLFEHERTSSGFESNENIGILYADLGDLDYFISGDNEAALINYENAVNNNCDNSSVRYKIGYIQYQKQNYPEALGSFIRSQDTSENDPHLLLALANTLSLNNDNYIARGYYERLLSILNVERERIGNVLPQIREDHADIVDIYMKASNNLGVTLSRIAATTGNSALNAASIVNLQESLRAWDAMTRNQATMIRLEGSNLAEQNIKYLTRPISDYEPEIYTEIPRMLSGEEGLEY